MNLSRTQLIVLLAAQRGTRGHRGLVDVAGEGAGFYSAARALVRKGALRPLGGDARMASEFWITAEGHKAVAEVEAREANARKHEGS